MMKWFVTLILCIGLLFYSNARGEAAQRADFPSLVSSIQVATPLAFCNEQVPTHIHDIRERLEKELLLSIWDRPQVILWLKRSRRYLPHLEKMLKEAGMPDDLKYVAIAESALRPHVASRKRAVGFWQFMAGTGRKYGLAINARVDERRNLFASTQAAIRYFEDLHNTFGSWTLVAAAFNMGEEGLMAEIIEQGTDDYYKLYLPLETQRFIFRILSVKLIFSDPEKYGFRLTDRDYYPPLEFDQVFVTCSQETPIRIIAQAAKTHFKVIKDLNPEIRGHYLAKGSHRISVPKGASFDFQARYEKHLKEFLTVQREQIYVVKKGDNLSMIAERFDVPLTALIIWNRIDPRRPIHPGDRIKIFPKRPGPGENASDTVKGKMNTKPSGVRN